MLFVSARRVHAGDLHLNLSRLNFLTYLENESPVGMSGRIKAHVRTRLASGEGPRVVCSINSVSALPKEFVTRFIDQEGVIVYDEARSTSGYIREYTVNEPPTFRQPDEVLNRLADT